MIVVIDLSSKRVAFLVGNIAQSINIGRLINILYLLIVQKKDCKASLVFISIKWPNSNEEKEQIEREKLHKSSLRRFDLSLIPMKYGF